MKYSFRQWIILSVVTLLGVLPAWGGSVTLPKPIKITLPMVTATPSNPYVGDNVTIKWQAPANAPGTLLGCRLRVDRYGPGPGTPQGPGQVGTYTVVNQSVSNTGQYTLSNVKPFKYRAGIRCNYKNGRPLSSRMLQIPVRPKPIKKSVNVPPST